MTDLPKISIVVPSFNQGRFIEETILSIINQDYPNIELIIIDGRSTDNSVEIIRNYEKYITYWVSEPDQGQRFALQKGFDRATGQVVTWQNTDDYYEPRVFGKVMEIFNEQPDIDLVYGNVRFVDEYSKQIGEMRFTPPHNWLMFFEKYPLHNQAAFFRRSLWDEMGGITLEEFFFDFDLLIRACRCSKKAKFIHQTLGNYRNHPGSCHFGGQHEHLRVDRMVILKRYLGLWGFFPRWVYKPISLGTFIYRTMWHIWIGDWDYLFIGFHRRVTKGISNAVDFLKIKASK